jgi:hypothetical protein
MMMTEKQYTKDTPKNKGNKCNNNKQTAGA